MDIGRSCSIRPFNFLIVPDTRLTVPANQPASNFAVGLLTRVIPPVRVRWYFAPETARPIPGGSCWGSTDWNDRFENALTTIGEIPRYEKSKYEGAIPNVMAPVWNNGRTPPGVLGNFFCGTLEDFQVPKIYANNLTTLARRPDGISLCCNPANHSLIVLGAKIPPDSALGLFSPPIPALGAIGLSVSPVGRSYLGLRSPFPYAYALCLAARAAGKALLGLENAPSTLGRVGLLAFPRTANKSAIGLETQSAAVGGVGLVKGKPGAYALGLLTGSSISLGALGLETTGQGTAGQGSLGLLPTEKKRIAPAIGDLVLAGPPITPTGQWHDLFIESVDTSLAVHLPDVGVGGYTQAAGDNSIVTGGVPGWINDPFGAGGPSDWQFDPLQPLRTASITFVFTALFGYVNIYWNGKAATIYGVPYGGPFVSSTSSTGSANVPVTLVVGTTYTMTITDDGTTFNVTCNGILNSRSSGTPPLNSLVGIQLYSFPTVDPTLRMIELSVNYP